MPDPLHHALASALRRVSPYTDRLPATVAQRVRQALLEYERVEAQEGAQEALREARRVIDNEIYYADVVGKRQLCGAVAKIEAALKGDPDVHRGTKE